MLGLIQANVKKKILIQIKNQMDVCINATLKLKYT